MSTTPRPFIPFNQGELAMGPLPDPVATPATPQKHPLMHALLRGAHILGQTLQNVENPEEAAQRRNAQTDQWNQVQSSVAQNIINNPTATPEQKSSALQRLARVFGQAQTADQAAQMLSGYSTPEQEREAAALELQKLKNQGTQAKQGNARPVPYYAGAVNLNTAQYMRDQGISFAGPDGQQIDIDSIPPGNILVPVYEAGGKSYWSLATDKGRYETGDNQRKFEPAVGGPNPEAPSVGMARVPTERVTTQTSPGGQQVISGTSLASPVAPRSERTPVAPGQVIPPAPPGEPPNPALHVRPSSTRTPIGPGKTQGSQSILPNIQGMTPQNATRAAKAQPAVTALLGLYGDPAHPEIKSMADYADLAADPHAQKVLGTAFKMLDQDMGEISDPGIIQTLMTSAGWASFRANAEAQAQRQTGEAMTPEEKEYFDTAIASMADIIGSRAATGQSPARFSVKSIQNELPLIGTSSTTDPQSYLTKMGTIARQIEVGLNSMPDNSRAMAYLNKRVNDLIQKGNSYSKKLNKGTPQQARKRKSLAAAMALPINKGKTAEQVAADIEAHGYEVARP